MFDKQARFWIGEFDGEKECAAGNEVSAITRHRIFVFGLSVGEGMACCLRFLTSLKLMFSDDIGGRLKALASTKLKVETANRQSSNRVPGGPPPRAVGWVYRIRLAAHVVNIDCGLFKF
jgi:hypothetical protein